MDIPFGMMSGMFRRKAELKARLVQQEAEYSHVPTVTVADANGRSGSQVLLDVREQKEWDAGHAPGAIHVRLGDLSLDSVPKADSILCICRSGHRSAQATYVLLATNLTAFNVDGGMNAWAAAGLPVVRDDGSPGQVI